MKKNLAKSLIYSLLSPTNEKEESIMLSNKVYDVLKWVAQIVLPALGALYFGLSQIWGLPYGEEIVGTITVIDVFMGALLGISTAQYNKEVQANGGKK